MADLSPQAVEAHGVRAVFEKYAFVLFIVIIAAVCIAAVVGVFIPPFAPGTPDWGQSIVARVVQIKDTVLDLLGALFAGTGGTMLRGHMDERLKQP